MDNLINRITGHSYIHKPSCEAMCGCFLQIKSYEDEVFKIKNTNTHNIHELTLTEMLEELEEHDKKFFNKLKELK